MAALIVILLLLLTFPIWGSLLLLIGVFFWGVLFWLAGVPITITSNAVKIGYVRWFKFYKIKQEPLSELDAKLLIILRSLPDRMMVRGSQRVIATREYRNETNSSLQEAIDYVDALAAKHKIYIDR